MNLRDMSSLSKDDLLNAIGLETRRTATDYVLPALGVFGAGLLVGAGLGLLFAPKSGRELRGSLRGRARETLEKIDAEEKVKAPTPTPTPQAQA